jgi:hypothetical protein
MTTEQIQKTRRRGEDIVAKFSRPKAEDPLIRYWIERKKEFDEIQEEKKKRT